MTTLLLPGNPPLWCVTFVHCIHNFRLVRIETCFMIFNTLCGLLCTTLHCPDSSEVRSDVLQIQHWCYRYNTGVTEIQQCSYRCHTVVTDKTLVLIIQFSQRYNTINIDARLVLQIQLSYKYNTVIVDINLVLELQHCIDRYSICNTIVTNTT